MTGWRNFLEPWIRNDWIKRDDKKYGLTEAGRDNLEMIGTGVCPTSPYLKYKCKHAATMHHCSVLTKRKRPEYTSKPEVMHHIRPSSFAGRPR